jgi:hypothetical protein
LKFEFQVSSDIRSNGGIAVRAEPGEKMPYPNGKFVFDHPLIKLTHPESNAKDGSGTTHWIQSAALYIQPTAVPAVVAAKWHAVEVAVRGDTCSASFDGKLAFAKTLDRAAPTPEGFVPGLKRTKGRVGFQINTGTVLYRNVQIKELTSANEEGFIPLFNGKDLTGWKTHSSQPGNWRVDKGVLIGSGAGASHLYTTRGDYKDFHLLAEVRINDGGNSGIYFRSPFGPFGQTPWPTGYEAQINSTQKVDPRKTGSLLGNHGNLVVIRDSPVPPGEWFTLEVIAEGNHMVLKVNGKTTANYTDERRQFTSGHIGVQQLNAETVAEFRKIEIKELPEVKLNQPVKKRLPADPFKANSVWVDGTRALTVLERRGETFRARFVIGTTIDREVTGTIKDGKVAWLSKDVRPLKGGAGGDNQATITKDVVGDLLDFTWHDNNGNSGTFLLRLRTGK